MGIIQSSDYTIRALGQFDVVKGDVSLVMSASSSKKLWELYKFLLVHRDRKFTPEALIDQVWVSESYSDPRSTLRSQMHRLRGILKEDGAESILYLNGYYQWNPEISVSVDLDAFEEHVRKGVEASEDPEVALGHYLKALDLYEGDCLPDLVSQHWIFSIRNYYRRLYLQTVERAVALLSARKDYDTIVSVCQDAVQIDVYEEVFHIHLMKALLAKGLQKDALVHYEQITGFYYREMGLKPSEEMRSLYKLLLQAHPTIQTESGLMALFETDKVLENAFYCEPEVFKSIYELERRRCERSGADFSIAVLTAEPIPRYTFAQNELRINQLKQHLLTHLRKGDSFTRWNDTQFTVLLLGVNDELMKKVMNRILSGFKDGEMVVLSSDR
jgi:DNA-binding SARP family transcriptional activator